ncbi:MAG: hypothetical protein GY710_17230 [Desulfobacteraceae bacterium]|nr:hypothetical protein [Desulfobacteraceae bacterium]
MSMETAMEKYFNQEKNKLASILSVLSGRGNTKFYDYLLDEVERIGDPWGNMLEQGSLSGQEIASLINKKYELVEKINQTKTKNIFDWLNLFFPGPLKS